MQYAPVVVLEPEQNKGNWKAVFGNDHPIQIEVGMGKGKFVSTMARQNPDINFIGIEVIEEAERIGMMLDVSHLNDAGFMDVAKYTKKPFLASHSNARAICNHVRNLSDDFIRILSNRGGIIGINFYPNFLTKVPANCENPGTIDAIIEHIKHIEKIGGIDCISLGSDFDGIEGHAELPDCSYMYRLIDALHSAGFKEDAIEKICYKNALRFYRELL